VVENWTTLALTFAPSVTVPAVPWKTAWPTAYAELTAPAALVQFVVALFQVPVPPSTTPLATVFAPSQ
jgi:hypothetical protein